MSEMELWREVKRLQQQVEQLQTRETSSRRWEGTIANNAVAYPFGQNTSYGGTFAGIFVVVEINVGTIAAFLTGGTLIQKIGDTHNNYTTTAGTAGKMNVYLDGNVNVVVQNLVGSSRLTWVQGWPIRSGN